MKKSFITGLIILLPLAITLMLGSFFVHLLTNPFMKITHSFLSYYTPISNSYLKFSSQVLIIVTLITLTLLAGFLTKIYLFDALVLRVHYLLHRIPLVNKIYKSCHEVVKTILSPQSTSFMQVVMVPFPQDHLRAFGFVTNDNINKDVARSSEPLVSVFIPATPNPTQGFVVLFPVNQVIFLDVTAEEALKVIVSAGLICTDIKVK